MIPSEEEVYLWCVRDEEAEEHVTTHLALLSPEELLRAQRLTASSVRRQYIITRASVRALLSHCFPSVSPREWTFERNSWGRPLIANVEARGRVSFNIAHTDGMIVIAMSSKGEVGVDVEKTSRSTRSVALADRYFSVAEAAALRALPAALAQQRFLDLWTLKESYIKACGMGLAIALHSFSFGLDDTNVRIQFTPQRQDDPGRWQFWQLQIGQAHLVGLALSDAGAESVRVCCFGLRNLLPGALEQVQILRQSSPGQDRMYSRTNLEP